MPPLILLSAGSNAQGQLATGDTEDAHSFTPCSFVDSHPGELPAGTTRIVDIACGANHTLLLLERSGTPTSGRSLRIELWGSGDGSKGQLGPSVASSTQVFRPLDLNLERLGLQGYNPTKIATCWETSYVVVQSPALDHDVVLSMGADDFGDLGIGGAMAKGKQVDGGVHIVRLLPEEPGASSTRITVSSLVTGPHHVLVHFAVRAEDGQTTEHLAGWGTSRHGQLGDWKDPTKGRPIPFLSSPHYILLTHHQDLDSVSPSKIAAGTHHTVVLRPSGRVSALGSNRKGQLSAVDELADVADIGCTWNGTYAVVRQASVDGAWGIISTGNHARGQLGRHVQRHANHIHPPGKVVFPFPGEAHKLVKMACGSEHIVIMVERLGETSQPPQTEVWGWGWNEHGNLGLGHTEDQDVPTALWPRSDSGQIQPQACDIWAGCGTSWILLYN